MAIQLSKEATVRLDIYECARNEGDERTQLFFAASFFYEFQRNVADGLQIDQATSTLLQTCARLDTDNKQNYSKALSAQLRAAACKLADHVLAINA